jgi:hypothetical protein
MAYIELKFPAAWNCHMDLKRMHRIVHFKDGAYNMGNTATKTVHTLRQDHMEQAIPPEERRQEELAFIRKKADDAKSEEERQARELEIKALMDAIKVDKMRNVPVTVVVDHGYPDK